MGIADIQRLKTEDRRQVFIELQKNHLKEKKYLEDMNNRLSEENSILKEKLEKIQKKCDEVSAHLEVITNQIMRYGKTE